MCRVRSRHSAALQHEDARIARTVRGLHSNLVVFCTEIYISSTTIRFPCKYAWTGCDFSWVDPAAHSHHIKGVHGHVPLPRNYNQKATRLGHAGSFSSEFSVDSWSDSSSAPSSPSSSSDCTSVSGWMSPASSDYATSPAPSFNEEDTCFQRDFKSPQFEIIPLVPIIDVDQVLDSQVRTVKAPILERTPSFSDLLTMSWTDYATVGLVDPFA